MKKRGKVIEGRNDLYSYSYTVILEKNTDFTRKIVFSLTKIQISNYVLLL